MRSKIKFCLELLIYVWIFLYLLLCCSIAQSYPTLCDPMDWSASVFILHHLPEFAQTQIHWVNDAIKPSHPLSSPSPPAQYLLCWLLITRILSISLRSSPAWGSGLDACPLTLHLHEMTDPTWHDSSLWKMSRGKGEENIRENQILILCLAANVVTPC